MFIVVFATNQRRSFDFVREYLIGLLRKAHRARNHSEKEMFPAILVGSKVDVIEYREVHAAEAMAFATSQNLPYIETRFKILLLLLHSGKLS